MDIKSLKTCSRAAGTVVPSALASVSSKPKTGFDHAPISIAASHEWSAFSRLDMPAAPHTGLHTHPTSGRRGRNFWLLPAHG